MDEPKVYTIYIERHGGHDAILRLIRIAKHLEKRDFKRDAEIIYNFLYCEVPTGTVDLLKKRYYEETLKGINEELIDRI